MDTHQHMWILLAQVIKFHHTSLVWVRLKIFLPFSSKNAHTIEKRKALLHRWKLPSSPPYPLLQFFGLKLAWKKTVKETLKAGSILSLVWLFPKVSRLVAVFCPQRSPDMIPIRYKCTVTDCLCSRFTAWAEKITGSMWIVEKTILIKRRMRSCRSGDYLTESEDNSRTEIQNPIFQDLAYHSIIKLPFSSPWKDVIPSLQQAHNTKVYHNKSIIQLSAYHTTNANKLLHPNCLFISWWTFSFKEVDSN